MTIRGFCRIIREPLSNVRRRVNSGINPAAHYRANLVELGCTPLEIAEWFAFFEAKIPVKFRKKPTQKSQKRMRSIPVKSLLNLDLTSEQNEQILAMPKLKRERIYSVISLLKTAQEVGVLNATATNKDLIKILEKSTYQIKVKRFKEIEKKIRNEGIQKFIDDFGKIGSGRAGKTNINEEDVLLFSQAYMSGSQHSVKECWEYMLGGRDPRNFACPQAFLYHLQKRKLKKRRIL